MNLSSTLVVFHAHPDDEAIFTGVTIRRAVDNGLRVVLVTATAGEAGESRITLPSGENLRQRRIAELERACELLGVARLVVLDYQDSGAHAGPYPTGTLGAADPSEVAGRVERVIVEEAAGALVHYDHQGIYGHVDHVQVYRAGRLAVARTGIPGYEVTVDRQALLRGPYHVVRAAANDSPTIGVPSGHVSFWLQATTSELLAKMAAMSAHSSQIGPRWLDPLEFAQGYGREWFISGGPAGVLESLAPPEPGSRADLTPQLAGARRLAGAGRPVG